MKSRIVGTKMKRLTDKNLYYEYEFCKECPYSGEPNGCNRGDGNCEAYFKFTEFADRLAELEDKLESGRLVELPCRVGDTVYGVGFCDCEQGHTDDEKLKRKIFNVCMTMNGWCDKCKYSRPNVEEFICTQIQIAEGEILVVGKKCENYVIENVFTDKFKAEVRLKELQEQKND